MNIKLFGCQIYISLLFMAMICLILFFDSTGIILLGLGAVVIHELGHIVFMAFCKQMPDKIIMQPAGIIIKRKNNMMKYSDELIVALGGCTFNFIFSVIFFIIYYVELNALWVIFSAANLSIGVFNLLPVSGLDGGDILRFFLYKFFAETKVDMICKTVSVLSAICLSVLLIYAMLLSKVSINLLLVLIYIIILVIINLRS